jgi:hypothetical protein
VEEALQTDIDSRIRGTDRCPHWCIHRSRFVVPNESTKVSFFCSLAENKAEFFQAADPRRFRAPLSLVWIARC